MTSISQVAQTMRTILTDVADESARATGFVKRESKIGGAEFAQMLTFGWLSNPAATLEELAQTSAALGVKISPQGLDQRFTASGAACLKNVLDEAVTKLMQGDKPNLSVLKRFTGVYIQDSSIVELPEELSEEWSGCGSGTKKGQAAVKVEVRLNLLQGEIIGPFLEDGRKNDAVSQIQYMPIPTGALRIADLGYWSLPEMNQQAERGVFWLSRLKNRIKVFTQDGKGGDILDYLNSLHDTQVDCHVYLTAQHCTSARLLAIRVPQEVADKRRHKLREEAKRRQKNISKRILALADWTILVTNVPQNLLSLVEALTLMRTRWQIELLFKLWKSHGQIDEWRSAKPWRILCEVYAKLLAMLVQHWLFLVSFWDFANRSWVKASRTIQKHALHLASNFVSPKAFETAIQTIQRCLEFGCRINKRKTDLRTFQLLEIISVERLA